MDKLRLRFAKRGRAVYISHLDLMRTMQRAFLRAGYALKYSEGFNPHPVISILLPLGVGCASDCELMDFSLTEPAELSLLPERLTAAMPEGIEALEAYPGGRKGRELKWLKLAGTLEYDSGDTTARGGADGVLPPGCAGDPEKDQARLWQERHRPRDPRAGVPSGGGRCHAHRHSFRAGADAESHAAHLRAGTACAGDRAGFCGVPAAGGL